MAKIVSLNKYYSGGHWGVRGRLKKKYKAIFTPLLEDCGVVMKKFDLAILYSSRHDPDNITGTEKLFVDTLKECGLIPDDNKKFFRGLHILPDESLKTNTILFCVNEVCDKDKYLESFKEWHQKKK